MLRHATLACVVLLTAVATASAQVRVSKNVMMPARDGVRLATDVYLPAGEEAEKQRLPAILIRTPYNKSGVAKVAEFFAKNHYAVAVQDVRGRFASQGTFYIYVNEGPDGFDAVQWVAKQPWCNGKVGTFGASYLAATQNALAVLRPPSLKTMFVMVGTSNYIEDGAGRGGAFALLHNMAYAFRLAQTSKEAAENKVTEKALGEAYEKLGDWLHVAPLKADSPLQWTPAYARWYADWRRHPTYDKYWKQNGYNFEEHHDQYPDIPICFLGGWYDIFKRGTLNNYVGLSRQSGRKAYTRLVMGPWTHTRNVTHAGDVDFGPGAKVDPNPEALTWFDQFLKGQDRGITKQPPVRYFLMAPGEAIKNKDGRLQSGGEWKTARTWPPSGLGEVKYYLHGNAGLGTEMYNGRSSSRFQFDPANPVPTVGGNIDSGKQLVRRGAQNQTLTVEDYGATNLLPLSARNDVLTFQTGPLKRDVEVTGPIRVELWVSSTAKDTDITAKLIDVFPPSADYPGGYAMNLEDGILRLRFRDSRERDKLLSPGEVYRVTIDLWATANLFRRGHRIRLDVSSSNFPMYDVNPNTGERLGRHTHTVKALNTIYHSPRHPSCLILPIRE